MPGAMEWLAEFHDLSTDRGISMGMGAMHVGPIPAASIDRAAARYPGEEEDFRLCIRAMDAAYLAEVRKPKDQRHRVHREKFGPQMMRTIGRVTGE